MQKFELRLIKHVLVFAVCEGDYVAVEVGS